MPIPDAPARLPQLEPEQFTPEAREMFARWKTGPFKDADTNPPLKTFAHHPRLADVFSQLNIHLLLESTLPIRERQIAIMRTTWLCAARYPWSSHLRTSLSFGLEPELFHPIQVGAADPYFTDHEKVLLLATDELVEDRYIGDANWQTLRAAWSPQQMLDFMFTVGAYVMIAGVMRSIGIERQQDLLDLAAQYGAPE